MGEMIKCLRKGRTWRRRKLIRNDKYYDIYNVAFIQWLKENGFVNKSLQLSHFYDTSRGLRAKINFKENDVLISIPKQLLISTGTVESSFVGKLMRKKFISSLAEIKTLIKYLLKNLAFEKNIFIDDN